MPQPESTHPLDTDLIELIEGTLESGRGTAVEAHLAACLLCRIKRQRLSGIPPIDLSDLRDLELPTFGRIDVEDADGTEAVAGELWLTSADDASMVLVQSVRENNWGVVVVPVVLDVEAADSGALIVNEAVSPIATPIAIYERMTISLPSTALASRVKFVRDLDLLTLADSDVGVTRGSPLEGAGDPRREIRQYLSDRLVALDPFPEEVDIEVDAVASESDSAAASDADEVFSDLMRHLFAYPDMTVDRLALPVVHSGEQHWRGIAQVHAFNQHLLIVHIDGGLSDADREEAAAICNRFNGSALAVRASEASDLVDVYPRSHLSKVTSILTGDRIEGPLLSMPLRTAVTSYVQLMTAIPPANTDEPRRGQQIDPKEILASNVATAVAAQVATGKAANIQPKKDGYQSVGDLAGELTEVLQLAFSAGFDPQQIVDLADEGGA
jgi:hypothetical protein